MNRSEPLLSIEELNTWFFVRNGIVRAVDGVTLSIAHGEVVGLVGESGSGKSVLGYSVMGLVDPPGRIVSGRILFEGEDLAGKSEREMERLRGRSIAMVFQDPMMTLNPVLRIDTQIIEAIRAHEKIKQKDAYIRACDALGQVGIPSPEERLSAYPHQFSGGMRQRVAIAIALLHRPQLIIADEPTTSLDVTVQSQILHEVQSLCRDAGTTLLWISHDLSVVAGLADRIVVMYAGRKVEEGPIDAVLDRPAHPYTVGLLGSIPRFERARRRLNPIPGTIPSVTDIMDGCRFRTRCRYADESCLKDPAGIGVGPDHTVHCVHPRRAVQ